MRHSELRQSFLGFFRERGHAVWPSAPLIPRDDPSLLFVNAGMVPFKPYWAGAAPLPFGTDAHGEPVRRAVSVQKCLRTSDLAQVGKSYKYNTFFEMLGNFSFGDYFKREAIPWAWEFMTTVAELDPTRLAVSVFEEDQEAYDVWREEVSLPAERIVKLGAADNFWGPAGGSGACGPCSEIYYDFGAALGCGKPTCGPGCSCPRWSEIYNIVFPQFDQRADGSRVPLANRGIDTGVGLERLAAATQGVTSVFETDIFVPLVRSYRALLGIDLTPATTPFIYAACDHVRALVFAITDGAIPSPETRGYMLRGILRRAVLMGRRAGVEQPLLYRLAGEVVELMKPYYPELEAKREQAALIIKSEEERFLRTLDQGLAIFEETVRSHEATRLIPGADVFKLHDTYGFPESLVAELAQDRGYETDHAGFEQLMAEQRVRSRTEGRDFGGAEVAPGLADRGTRPHFIGYETCETDAEVIAVTRTDAEYEVILAATPFYAEAGGQVGDTGRVFGPDFELEVLDTFVKQGVPVLRAKATRGTPVPGPVHAAVDLERRREVERAHTATHLLQAALRAELGDFVHQQGSSVEPGRLRFDFTAPTGLTPEQVARVEAAVYARVLDNLPLRTQTMPLAAARDSGALAFFGEQYGAEVRVVEVEGFSRELCGGTHLRATGEVGLFRIVSESGIAAGIRRIEAVVGEQARSLADAERRTLARTGELLGVVPTALPDRLADLLERQKKTEARLRRYSTAMAQVFAEELALRAEVVNGVRVVTGSFGNLDRDELRVVADRVRDRLRTGFVGLVVSTLEPRLAYVVFVSEDLAGQYPAGALARDVGRLLGGGGGGRPTLADGGGTRAEGIPRALALIRERIAGRPSSETTREEG